MTVQRLQEKDRQTTREPSQYAPSQGKAVGDFFGTDEIFLRVLATAHHELHLPFHTFAWGALAAGLFIGFSFLAKVVVSSSLPEGTENELVSNLLYPIGFIFVILGRYPLYTENTLTPVTLVLTRFASLPDLVRVWGLALSLNLVGGGLFALLLTSTGIFSAADENVAREFGQHLFQASWSTAFSKSLLAGWLLAGLVLLVHAARETVARILLVWMVIYLQASAHLFHCIVGSVEALYIVFTGNAYFMSYIVDFLIPTLLGNTVGGVVFVAVLNYARLSDNKDHLGERLSWREWCVGSSIKSKEEFYST